MDRKNFLRNLFGAAAAVTVGKYLEPLASIPATIVPPSAVHFPESGIWMDHQMWLFQQKWMEQLERNYWRYGPPKGKMNTIATGLYTQLKSTNHGSQEIHP